MECDIAEIRRDREKVEKEITNWQKVHGHFETISSDYNLIQIFSMDILQLLLSSNLSFGCILDGYFLEFAP